MFKMYVTHVPRIERYCWASHTLLMCRFVSPFDKDPHKDRFGLISQRNAEYFAQYPDFGPIIHCLINDDRNLFRCGILLLIQVSKCLESQL